MPDSNVAIVTGGAEGLGASITKKLLKNGYKVVVADIQEKKGKKTVKELAKSFGIENVLFYLCDITKLEDFKNLFQYTIKEFERVDVLVNNAGILDERRPQEVMNINVIGTMNGCQTALQFMGKSNGGKGGAVINIASVGGFLAHPCYPSYIASKYAIIGMTRCYGHSHCFKKDNVLFSALCPSGMKTNIVKNWSDIHFIKGLKYCEMSQVQSTDDVAAGVIKLLDDKLNGSTLVSTKKEGLFYVGVQQEFEKFIS